MTNQPGKVHTTKTLPRLDHDIVFLEISIPIGRPIQPKRKIKLHRKTNWEQFKADINSFSESFQSEDESATNKLWSIFKTEIDRLSNIHIPSKMTRSRSDLPWITSSIKKKINKRDKLYHKVKQSRGKQTHDKLKSKLTKFKSIIQKGIRKSYVEYLDSVMFSNDADRCKNKKLYTFIKHKHTENTGISPLKSEGSTYTDPTQQATILNKQFESVLSKPKVLSLKSLQN